MKPQVTEYQGKSWAQKHGFPFYEASAKDGTNVETAFRTLIEECVGHIDSGKGNAPVLVPPELDLNKPYTSTPSENSCCQFL